MLCNNFMHFIIGGYIESMVFGHSKFMHLAPVVRNLVGEEIARG